MSEERMRQETRKSTGLDFQRREILGKGQSSIFLVCVDGVFPIVREVTFVFREGISPAAIDTDATHVVFAGLDQAMACVAVQDLLRTDVMIAHSREGKPLSRDHGAPYRLVVPHLYG